MQAPSLPADAEILPSTLSRSEIQLLQDALIWNGAYIGLKDGGWGRMSADGVREWRRQRGLRVSETFTPGEFALLLGDAIKARNAVGWSTMRDPYTGIWIGIPAALLRKSTKRTLPAPFFAGSDYEAVDDRVTLSTRSFRGDLGIARDVMATAIGALRDAGGVPGYRLDRPDRQVAAIDLPGRSVYIRYDRVDDEWRGFTAMTRQNDTIVRYLISAMSAEFNPLGTPTVVGDGPVLSPILAGLASQGNMTADASSGMPGSATMPGASRTAAPATATPVAPAVEVSGSGTAFAVRRDGTMLTNNHVVEGCRSLTLKSGERVTVVAADPQADLAILRVSGHVFERVAHFRRDQTIDLGESVTAFGYPLYQSVSTALNITNGIVSATVGVNDNPVNFQINAALQPGNSGGPVLDAAGLVIGVAVARLSDRRIMAATGSIPQTMNYAVRGQIAEAFLLSNGILVDKVKSEGRADLRDVAVAMQEAVVPVLCYR